MKSMIIVALALVAVAVALPLEDKNAGTLVEIVEQKPDGSYTTKLKTENGINREEVGSLKEVVDEENKRHTVLVVRGQFSYTKADGSVETVQYYADETGFHPEGDSLPVAPVARR